MREILETTCFVVEKSRHVLVDKKALVRFSRELSTDGIQVPAWEPSCHFFDGGEKTVSYLLVLDSLNFCFWPVRGTPKWEFEYGAKRFSGYYALAASLKQAVEKGVPLNRADYLSELKLDELKRVLGGTGELQLLDRRVAILNELGQVLMKAYSGKAHELVKAAEGSAVRLYRLLGLHLRSFDDWATYLGRKVLFYKRAQIFAADLYGAFGGKDWGAFGDMDRLTSFADYKLPQVLRHIGILHYSRALADRVDQETLIEPGSREEVEIRAGTIQAVELIRQELGNLGSDLKAFEIDWILWNMGQREEFKKKPYHRTLTIFY